MMPALAFALIFPTVYTDAGLVHLKGLPKRQRLLLDKTRVTEAGVNELKKAFPRADISR